MPFGRFGSGAASASATPSTTPFKMFVTPAGSSENFSCNPNNGPGVVPLMPGGYKLCARKPTVRVDQARFVSEKNNAVRAFCTETSQLKTVASPTRNVPRIVGDTPG